VGYGLTKNGRNGRLDGFFHVTCYEEAMPKRGSRDRDDDASASKRSQRNREEEDKDMDALVDLLQRAPVRPSFTPMAGITEAGGFDLEAARRQMLQDMEARKRPQPLSWEALVRLRNRKSTGLRPRHRKPVARGRKPIARGRRCGRGRSSRRCAYM
jgi:hypothetical protein